MYMCPRPLVYIVRLGVLVQVSRSFIGGRSCIYPDLAPPAALLLYPPPIGLHFSSQNFTSSPDRRSASNQAILLPIRGYTFDIGHSHSFSLCTSLCLIFSSTSLLCPENFLSFLYSTRSAGPTGDVLMTVRRLVFSFPIHNIIPVLMCCWGRR
ncbi:hypothetical protein P280DRAFT_318926 [Massarina eburnea CBS 473.64]|uniref:Uncharacterized protein n=1 Tax=Massarina eburnea CBS 473.64 TaxID=1395130 RepID=A0A6A6RGP9_9PLEO|nr:hypothetical protein P280DRAFT_318926 [Massarina eburnea CBS 473.64]